MTYDVEAVKGMSDDQLLGNLGAVRPDTPIAELMKAEIQLRIAERQMKAAQASTDLGQRIWWLNVWLLVFTAALFALTFAQIVIAVRGTR